MIHAHKLLQECPLSAGETRLGGASKSVADVSWPRCPLSWMLKSINSHGSVCLASGCFKRFSRFSLRHHLHQLVLCHYSHTLLTIVDTSLNGRLSDTNLCSKIPLRVRLIISPPLNLNSNSSIDWITTVAACTTIMPSLLFPKKNASMRFSIGFIISELRVISRRRTNISCARCCGVEMDSKMRSQHWTTSTVALGSRIPGTGALCAVAQRHFGITDRVAGRFCLVQSVEESPFRGELRHSSVTWVANALASQKSHGLTVQYPRRSQGCQNLHESSVN